MWLLQKFYLKKIMEVTQKKQNKTYVPLPENMSEETKHQNEECNLEKTETQAEYISISIPNLDTQMQKLRDEEDPFLIYIKFKDNSQKEVNIRNILNEKVAELLKIAFPEDFNDENKVIRLIYQGRLLKKEETIIATKIEKGSFIHGVISEKIQPLEIEKNEETKNNNNSNENNNENILPNSNLENANVERAHTLITLMRELRERANANDQNRERPPENFQFVFGVFLGYFMGIWAIAIVCMCESPPKTRIGVFIGFFWHTLLKSLGFVKN